MQPSNLVQLVPATSSDGGFLADLRVDAMRPSLEAVGRFDPDRARQRFLSTFSPDETWKLDWQGEIVGFLVLRAKEDHLYLDHLYVAPSFQGKGIGHFAIEHVKQRASTESLPLRLLALNGSPANGFYQMKGFGVIGGDDLDTLYEWRPPTL